jgi:hypothetical protein
MDGITTKKKEILYIKKEREGREGKRKEKLLT